MRILVKGSMNWDEGRRRVRRFSDREEYQAAFRRACRALGKRLAEREHVILIGSYCTQTVGPHVLEGANCVPGARAEAYRPEDERFAGDKFCEEPAGLSRLNLTSRPNPGGWSQALLPALKHADVMITLGGSNNTQSVGYAARALGKPNLAIPIFGGEAEQLWRMSRDDYEERYLIGRELLDVLWQPGSGAQVPEDTRAVSEGEEAAVIPAPAPSGDGNWEEWAVKIVGVAEKLARRQHRLGDSPWLATMIVSAPVLMLLWASLISQLGSGEPVASSWMLFSLALLVIISALLGTLLRVAIRLLGPQSVRLSLAFLVPELVGGLVVAFVLWLLYMLGGVAYPGAEAAAVLQPETSAEAVRVAVAVSFLSLVGAMLLERAYGSVSRRGGALLEE